MIKETRSGVTPQIEGESNSGFTWCIAKDTQQIHKLLCESDILNAKNLSKVPIRSMDSTERYISEDAVHALMSHVGYVATFTLTKSPPRDFDLSYFVKGRTALYLQRLVVPPSISSKDALIGARCILYACELAKCARVQELRCEVNPDLTKVTQLLSLLGFSICGDTVARNGRRIAYMMKTFLPTNS